MSTEPHNITQDSPVNAKVRASEFSAYDIFKGIHRIDSRAISSELRCLNLVLSQSSKAKSVNDVKLRLLESIKKSSQSDGMASQLHSLLGSQCQASYPGKQADTSFGTRRKRRMAPSNATQIIQQCASMDQSDSIGEILVEDNPYASVGVGKRKPSFRYGSESFIDTAGQKSRVGKSACFQRGSNNDSGRFKRNAVSMDYVPELRGRRSKAMTIRTGTIHKYITELNKIIHSDEEDEEKGTSSHMRAGTRNRWILEEYRQEREQRTQNILNDIDATDMNIIIPLYSYKLDALLNHEEEALELKQRLRRMLGDSNRMVARIERGALAKRRLRALLKSKTH